MTDITEIDTSYNISSILKNYDIIKYNPAAIIGLTLDYLSSVTSGKVDIVDPTNPFVMALESSAVNTAAAILESQLLLRKQYPVLAQTEEELYRHMSDKDYLNRFSSPSSTKFNIVIEYNSLYNYAISVPNTTYKKITIPRDSVLKAEETEFTLQYPIDIRLHDSGNVTVLYDTEILSPLQSLSTNIIPSEVMKMTDGTKCVNFSIDVLQCSIKSVNAVIDATTPFTKTINFTDKFYYCRVFYKSKASSNEWVEIQTTHTDQVYDINKPTAVLQVMDTKLKVDIPLVYTDQGLLSGSLRIDIYTTKGNIYLNLKDYKLSSFSAKLKAINELRDISNYTVAMNKCNYYLYSSTIVSGGSNGLTFKELKERVINNSIGDPNVPITNVQLINSKYIDGFEISKNIDSVTNRIYVISKQLPSPTSTKLITPANITVLTFLTDLSALKETPGCYDNDVRVTISTDVMYKDNNGELSLINSDQVEALKALAPIDLVEECNSVKYFYSPFHYVLDNSSSTFSLRAYYLDSPLMNTINFIDANSSMQATVNTSLYTITKTSKGYGILLITKSDDLYKSIPKTSLGVVMSFIPYGETSPVYIKGVYVGTSEASDTSGEAIFSFTLETNFDIDDNDCIHITNAQIDVNSYENVAMELSTKLTFFYCTNAIPTTIRYSNMDSEFPTWYYTDSKWLPITKEQINLIVGRRMKNLWTQTKSIKSTSSYEKYTEDVPLRYTEDVFDYGEDGTIISLDGHGNPVYTVLHHKGDIVYDEDGDIVYKYRKGDIKLDENGSPISSSEDFIKRAIDLLLIDGSYGFTTDPFYKSYKKEIATTLVSWITESLADIDSNLLEQTHIYYRPKLTLGNVDVNIGDNKIISISAEQSFKVTMYVEDSIYKDTVLRSEIETKVVSYINSFLDTDRVNISDLTQGLKEVCGSTIITLKVEGLGGFDNNYETITLYNDTSRLCLNKKLTVQSDNSIIVKEDVEFAYIKYTSTLE